MFNDFGHYRDIRLEGEIAGKLFNINLVPRTDKLKARRPPKINIGNIDNMKNSIIMGDQQAVIENGFNDIMGYLMENKDHDFMRNLVHELGFSNLEDKIHVLFNLVHFLIGDTDRILNNEEIAYISGQPIYVLQSIFPYALNSNYNIDREGILYTMVTGHTLPRRLSVNNPERYMEITEVNPYNVWRWWVLSYDAKINLSPYDFMASSPETPIAEVFMAATKENVDELMNIYGVVPSPKVPPRINENYKLKEFLDQIIDYDRVFARNPNLGPPPPDPCNNKFGVPNPNVLLQYTTRELLDAYTYDGIWENRYDLVRRINC